MLSAHALDARIDGVTLFEGVSFSVNAGETLGVIGPNGSGKSTLLAILAGERRPDAGAIALRPGTSIGYLRQGFADRLGGTLADLVDGPGNGLIGALRESENAAADLASATDLDAAMDRYDAATADLEARGSYPAVDALITAMHRLAVGPDDLGRGWSTPLTDLSGGQKTRAGLAALLYSRPDLLLLDEPTNHLDTEAAETVETMIREQRGAIVVVSHDRELLDRVATSVLSFDDLDTGWRITAGGYSAYLDAREAEAEEQAAAWHRQRETVARLEAGLQSISDRAQKVEGDIHVVTNRWKKFARVAVVRERRIRRMLDAEDSVDKPSLRWGLSVEMPAPAPGGRDVVTVEGLTVQLGGQTILRGLDLTIRSGERVALLGPNGSGKTTLIRAILGEVEPDRGSVRLGATIRVGRFAQEQEGLRLEQSALWHIRSVAPVSESEARTFLHRYLFSGDAALAPVATRSWGERARLALAMMIAQEANFLVLDEPLNHLDLDSREQFEAALAGYSGAVLMVLHDRRAIRRLATRAVRLDRGRLADNDLPGE